VADDQANCVGVTAAASFGALDTETAYFVPVFVGSALTVVVSVRDPPIFLTVHIKLIEVIIAFHARCAVNVVETLFALKALFVSVVRVTCLAVLNPANWFAVVGLAVESSVAVTGAVE
jgi:hypothetical protein